MNVMPSYEQEEFRTGVRRLADAAPLEPGGFDAARYAAAWSRFAEAGVAGLCLAPVMGGFSGAAEDVALIAAELGRAPGATPRIETMVLAAVLLSSGAEPAIARLREKFAAGQSQPAVAWFEGGDPYGQDMPQVQATRTDDGFTLTGRKMAVIGATTADCLIVTAQLPARGLGLFVVDPAAARVDMRGYRLSDTTPVADIVFHDTPALTDRPIAEGEHARAILHKALDHALIAQCAATLGGMDRAINLSIEHLKTRQQFGRPLADFQALQHRVADMFIATNDARSILYAAIAASRGDAVPRAAAASRCKVKISTSARSVIGDALHLHGGIGITTEYPVGHLYRRAMVDSLLMGDADYHLARLEAGGVDWRMDEQPAGVVECLARA
ncbi:acyl-CoA dehydrogenase [Sphingobium sp. AN558]|uniref:acyl-CoA dehydrogenase family protein n=1 Tax=Sphingobium sp. AN558 TaxID=3133442 RepID=UPI0030BF3B86